MMTTTPTLTTLVITLSALAVGSSAGPIQDTGALAAGRVFAGAPADGVYPDDMEGAAGWESEAYKPTHEQAAVDDSVSFLF